MRHSNLRRGEDIDRLLLPPLLDHPLWLLIGEAKDQRGPNTLIRREDDIRPSSSSTSSHSVNDYGRYNRT